jgi:hypothetical protein
MNRKKILIALLTMAVYGCSSWKSSLVNKGDYNVAIKNAIIDIMHSDHSYLKDDSVFSIGFRNLEGGLIGVSIFGVSDEFLVTEDKKTDSTIFPTRYYEQSNKLFYWKDPKVGLNNEILLKLDQYGQIDSLPSIAFAELAINDGKKGVLYYFCENNLLEYKKLKTDVSKGWSDWQPGLKCD